MIAFVEDLTRKFIVIDLFDYYDLLQPQGCSWAGAESVLVDNIDVVIFGSYSLRVNLTLHIIRIIALAVAAYVFMSIEKLLAVALRKK